MHEGSRWRAANAAGSTWSYSEDVIRNGGSETKHRLTWWVLVHSFSVHTEQAPEMKLRQNGSTRKDARTDTHKLVLCTVLTQWTYFFLINETRSHLAVILLAWLYRVG